jgi:arginyl-tRNA synthetase
LPATFEVVIERPKNREHGDYSSNVAMVLAKQLATSPRELAQLIAARLTGLPGITEVSVAGPGFLNISVEAQAQGELAKKIVELAASYGRNHALAGQRINVEFISANPTGPLHLGHTRWAALGDAICRVLRASGAEVESEFYVNDRGAQVEKFGESLQAVAKGEQVPEDGYHGAYVMDIALAIVADNPGLNQLPAAEQQKVFAVQGIARQQLEQERTLTVFRTQFHRWVSEHLLHESGKVDEALSRLKDRGVIYEQDGATWLRTTDFGDDKDRVLRKSNGDYTYFTSDTAYYLDKRARGFDQVIYLLGADHHGYIGRLRALASCFGDDPDANLQVLIGQLVKVVRGNEEVKLSKRTGTLVTLAELVEEVGVDAARYALIRSPADTPMTLHLELLVKHTNDNPVFYVQYAHARIASVLRNAYERGIAWRESGFDPSLLSTEAERDLLGVLEQFSSVVATAAELREPHRVARYLETLAGAYHRFYDNCRVLPGSDEATTSINIARLWLCAATRQTLANGLELCGVSAPEKM